MVGAKVEPVKAAADQMYETLCATGVDVLYDDRDASAGVKFADADLIGCPLQLVLGKTYAASGKLEAKVRATGEKFEVDASADAIAAAPPTARTESAPRT